MLTAMIRGMPRSQSESTIGAVTIAMNPATRTGASRGADSLIPAPITTTEAMTKTTRPPRGTDMQSM